MRRTKIICTLGPASRDPAVLRELVRAGMDVARLNMSHGQPEEHAETVRRVRAAADAEGRPVAVLVDLQGPKFRVGEVTHGRRSVAAGERLTLATPMAIRGAPGAVAVQNDVLPVIVAPGSRVLIDDGLIELRVTEMADGLIHCEVVTGGTIQSNKGINLPGVAAALPSLTDKDHLDLARALSWEVDWIALSFVRGATDVVALRQAIGQRTDRFVPVVAKIEKPEALDHLAEIIAAADAVMVARGDLGIEIPAEQVPMVQKRIIRRCNERGVPVITATQMLDSMIRNPRPTRAEATDVANAMLDGTDAVMLAGETAIGRYPVDSLRTLDRIAHEVEGGGRPWPSGRFSPRAPRWRMPSPGRWDGRPARLWRSWGRRRSSPSRRPATLRAWCPSIGPARPSWPSPPTSGYGAACSCTGA